MNIIMAIVPIKEIVNKLLKKKKKNFQKNSLYKKNHPRKKITM